MTWRKSRFESVKVHQDFFESISSMKNDPDYWQKIQEMQQRERQIAEAQRKEKMYDERNMDCEKMPLGCWGVIAAAIFILYLIIEAFKHHK